MLDISELNLYKLDETFSKLEDSKILIKSILGDAKDLLLLKNIFSKYYIHTQYLNSKKVLKKPDVNIRR